MKSLWIKVKAMVKGIFATDTDMTKQDAPKFQF